MQNTELNTEELEKTYQTSAIIVIAQIMTTLILIGVAWFVITYSTNDISDTAYSALWTIVLFVALGSLVLRRMLFNWERLKTIALLKGISGLLKNLQTNTILLAALGEVIAVIGFLIAVLSGNKMEMLRAGAIALIIFLINFPRKSNWKQIIAAAGKLKTV